MPLEGAAAPFIDRYQDDHSVQPILTPIGNEVGCYREWMRLRLSPVYYGRGVPHGNGEPVEPGSSDVGRILAQTPPPNLEVSAGTEVDVVVGESSETEGDQIGPEQPEGEGGETEGIDQAG